MTFECESLLAFDPVVQPGCEDMAVAEACVAAKAMNSGAHIIYFLAGC